MFGYVLPDIPKLRVCEYEFYKATYCGLCKEIKKIFGNFSRLNLSYDIVFLAIFFKCYLKENFKFKEKTCYIHPFKKRFYIKSCKSLEKSANIGVILFYFKLKDNVYDYTGFKKILNMFLLLLFKKKYYKAKKNEKEIANFVSCFIENQNKLEKKHNLSLDSYSHPTANCLGEILKNLALTKQDETILYRLGYMLGKYIYLMDALDDFEKDLKNNNFNPIIYTKYEKDNFKQVNELINFSIAQLAEAFEKIKFKTNVDILKNIIYFGLKSTKEKLIKNKVKDKTFKAN